MKTATISELKASLSEYLSKVKAGEKVIVTERGKPIAKLTPLEREDSDISEHLLMLKRAGLVSIGTGQLPQGIWDLPRPKDHKGLALEALLKERAETR